MNEHLRDRILRKLETLSDERGYQVLDYVEFLESRYAERQSPTASSFTRFTEAVEDRLRAGRVSASTIAEAVGLMNRAANVLNGALAAGRSVANDLVSASRSSGGAASATSGASGPPPTSTAAAGASAPGDSAGSTSGGREASSPAHDTRMPGSGEEKL